MPAGSLEEQLVKYLADAHSIETQALAQLRTAPDIAVDPGLTAAFREHLAETEGQERLIRERLEAHGGKPVRGEGGGHGRRRQGLHPVPHQRLLEERLQQRGAAPSKLKDAVMRVGGLNGGMFFQAQPGTPGKLAAFTFAFEHLEIGGYELLKRVALKAGDSETVEAAEQILAEERAAADKIQAVFDRAAEASLEAVGVAPV